METHTAPTAPPSAGHSPLVAVEWDAEGRVTRWPAEAEALFGWRADEVLGKRLEEWPFVHPDDREAVRRSTRDLVRGAIRQNLSINRNLTRDGRVIHCEWYNTAVVDGAGKLAAQLSLGLDVTARERAFAEMQAARAAAERAAERTRGLQWVTAALSEALTPAAVTRVVVEQAIALLGAASAVVVLLDASGEWLELVGHEGYAPEALEKWRTFSRHTPVPLADSVRTGEPVVLRSVGERAARYPHLAGGGGYPAILSVPLSVEGEVLGALGLGFAHEQALGEEEVALAMALGRQCAQAVRRANLLQAERGARREVESLGERLHLALASADVGTWDFDPVSGALSWDQRCRTIMGLPGGEPVDYAAFRAALHPDDRERTDEAVEAALDPRGSGEFAAEYRTVDAGGVVRWALARGRAFFEGAGSERRAVRFIGTIIDNTERKAAEAERERLVAQLRTERERLAEIFARAPVSIAVLRGPELRIELANELALTFGNRRDVVGMTVRDAFPELEEQGFFDLLEAVRATGRPFHGRDVPVRFARDGEVRNAFFDVTCHPLLDSDGGVEGIITLHFDVTERVHARRRMELLAEAGTALALSSDPAGVLRALARIAASRLARACAVFLAPAHGAPGQAQAAVREAGEVRFHDVAPPESLPASHP
ncbi:MAG: PAS domain S-box protein, partial [Gemmatimonadetes bacterium]|nr:PAS domain S-box protein [Gemmatimonadota bacterium]